MARDENVPDVDFVVGAGGDVQPRDEDLAERQPRARPRRDIAIGAVGLVVAGLLARTLSTHESSPKPAPSQTLTTPAARAGPPAANSGITPLRDGGNLADCPRADDGQSICETRHHVPAAVLAAVRVRFPGARYASVLDEQLRDVGFGPGGIWYRLLRIKDGERTIVVELHRLRAGDTEHIRTGYVSDRVQVDVTRLAAAVTVDVRVSAPAIRPPSAQVISALAGDARLLAGG